MATKESKRVAIYARTSAEDRQALEAEMEKVREYAEGNGHTVAREYVDAEGNRDQFTQMMADAEQKPPPFEEIIVWDISRFSRSTEEFQEWNAKLVLQRRVMRKHAQVFFFSYGPFIMGDSHSFVASFKIRPRVTL